MDNAQNPVGPVLTAAENRRRVLHNMCSSLLYNLSVIPVSYTHLTLPTKRIV